MIRCPDGRTYLTGSEVYKFEGKALVGLEEFSICLWERLLGEMET